jgi:large subunit ribosomal protein L25
MESATIQGEPRGPQGHHGNERLRQRGLLPAVIYGHGEAPEMISLSLHDFELALSHTQRVVKVQVGGREQQYLVKDVQFDHLQKTPIHVDLMRVDVSERVRVTVALEFRGTPKGVAEGGTLVTVAAEVEVECPVLQIPESIRVRVEHLGMNESIKLRDVEAPAEVKLLGDPDDILAVVHPPREEEPTTAEAAASEGAAEPEVIAKGKEEDAEGGD